MSKKIIIINGPNLNILGDREKEHYGENTIETLKLNCQKHAKSI